MRTRICLPGENILDAAGFVAIEALRNALTLPYVDGISGYQGARYGLTKQHVKLVFDMGKCFNPNWERRGNEAMFGAGAWAVDSSIATMESWDLDWSLCPTIFSGVDFSTVPSQYNQLDYWHHTLVDRALSKTPAFWGGFYGDVEYGNHLVAQDWWPRHWMVWSWGGDGGRMITGSNMKQWYGYPSHNDYSSIGCIVDESTVQGGMVMAMSYDSPEPEVLMASHVTYARAPDGSFVQIVDRLDGTQGWRHVGDIPGGAGGFYAVHPGGAGVNSVGQNEMDVMGHYDNVQDQQWVAAHAGGGGGATPAQVVDELARRLSNG